MNQDIKVSTALLIVLLFGGILIAKFWALSASYSVQGFSYLHHHPDGSSFIMVGNQLLGFDTQGQHQTTIKLSQFQVTESSNTDFAFFSNGDVLVRQRTRDNNFIENLQRYYRFANPTDKNSVDAKDGLFRCSPVSLKCKAFTKPALNLNDAFSIAIDWTTDRVFLADSSRHRVDMYSDAGELLDSRQWFRFPNQLEVADNRLYVADTNFHRLIAFDISDNAFGEIKEEFDTRTEQSRQLGEVWPGAFLLLSDQRWVINHKNGMKDGGVYIFDEEGEFHQKLQLPDDADPFALLEMGEQILISDYSHDRIYRFRLDGSLQDDFNPPALDKITSELAKRRHYYQQLDTGFSILFAASFAGSLLLAFFQQSRKQTSDSGEQQSNPEIVQQPTTKEPVLYWVKPSSRFKLTGYFLICLAGFFMILLIALEVLSGNNVVTIFKQYWWLLLLLLVSIAGLLLQLRRRIGLTENSLVIRPVLGAEITCLKHKIMLNDVIIVAGKSVFQVDQLYKLFSANDVENHLYPAFIQGRQVERADMQVVLGKNSAVRVIQFVIMTGLVGLFVYYSIYQ